MPSTTVPHLFKLCTFEDYGKHPYLCYKNEICCKEGCCVNTSFRIFQTWYFWVAVMLVFLSYRYIASYCQKRAAQERFRHEMAQVPLPVEQPAAHPARQMPHRPKPTEPPPNYADALKLPKPDEVPTYEQATKYIP